MAKYNKTKQGYFETSKFINGKRVRFRGKTCAEVDKKIIEYRSDKKQGRKIKEIAEEWMLSIEGNVSEGTRRSYIKKAELFCEQIGNKRAGAVTTQDLRKIVTWYEAKGRSASTVHIFKTVIKMIFSFAVQIGEIPYSPAAELKQSKNLPKTERKALTEEQELLVENFRGDDYLLGLFLLYTGMRKGELLALTWQDIDLSAGVIHVTKKLNYIDNIPRLETFLKSKNGYRDIPILDELRAALPTGKRIGVIFHDGKGNYLKSGEATKRWYKYAGAVGGLDGVTMHCFRHSFATILYEAGLDEKSAASIVGDSEQIVRNVYQELRDSRRATSAEKVNAYLALRRKEKETAAK